MDESNKAADGSPDPHPELGAGCLTAIVWTASVVFAAIAFTIWASVRMRHFGQGCPLGLPDAPDPTLAGAITVGAAIFVVVLARRYSHIRTVLFILVIAAVIAVIALETVSWWLVGVSHYCND